MNRNRDWLTEAEVAAITKHTRKTLRNWRYLRKGPPFTRAGGKVLYDQRDVEQWLAAGRVATDGRVAG